jgi:hypothetical protein
MFAHHNMSDISSYTFLHMSRIGNDDVSQSQTELQNSQSCSYMTQNVFASDCYMNNVRDLAMTQPGIMYKGGYTPDSCRIEDSSKLQIGSIQTHPKCHISLFQRPFATVPFLGRGSVNSVTESQIMQGEQLLNKRSVTNIGEKSYIRYHQTPLQADTKERMQNHLIESDIGKNWIHGGMASREMHRDTR